MVGWVFSEFRRIRKMLQVWVWGEDLEYSLREQERFYHSSSAPPETSTRPFSVTSVPLVSRALRRRVPDLRDSGGVDKTNPSQGRQKSVFEF